MSQSVSELIGRIINPAPTAPASAPTSVRRSGPADESVEQLLERIIYPHGRPVARWANRAADPGSQSAAAEPLPMPRP